MPDSFATTRWSVVLAAGGSDLEPARVALETLCGQYWYPLYAYVRRHGYDVAAAEDLTQGFFVMVLQRRDLAKADPARGRFRAFLLTALKHFLLNQRELELALKRGGDRVHVSIDRASAELRYAAEPTWNDSPDVLFDRRWALALLERVRQSLLDDYIADGNAALFESLQGVLTGEGCDSTYRDVAQRLGLTEGAVKVAAHRLRQRFGQKLRDEIAQTVASAEEIDDEIRYLFTVLGGA